MGLSGSEEAQVGYLHQLLGYQRQQVVVLNVGEANPTRDGE
jgi:hypothetical protein